MGRWISVPYCYLLSSFDNWDSQTIRYSPVFTLLSQGINVWQLLRYGGNNHRTYKFQGALWRTIYFYLFLLFSGVLGYVNQLSVGRILDQRTPYKMFVSWRFLFLHWSLFLLIALWIINSFRYLKYQKYDSSLSSYNLLRSLFIVSSTLLELLFTLTVCNYGFSNV